VAGTFGVGVSLCIATLMEEEMLRDHAVLNSSDSGSSPVEKPSKTRQLTVKGVDEKTLAAAREAARRKGLRVSAWIRMEIQEAAARTLREVSPTTELAEKVLKELIARIELIQSQQAEEQSKLDEIRTHVTDMVKIQHGLISRSFDR
jgi:hypothetical protein